MKSIYVQWLFLYINLKDIYWLERISIEINLLSIHLNLLLIDFPFKPQRNLLIRMDFNWHQFTFNSFESTFNWFSFLIQNKSPQQVFVHNRVPSKQLHYWVFAPWRIVWELFFNMGLIRHLIMWEALHVQDFNIDKAF